MASGVSKELEVLIRSKLRDLVNGEPGSMAFIHYGTHPLEADAISYLADIGAFERVGTGSFRDTARGREYWDQLNAPRWYWFRRNWFAASVAGATIVAASVSAAANIANLVLESGWSRGSLTALPSLPYLYRDRDFGTPVERLEIRRLRRPHDLEPTWRLGDDNTRRSRRSCCRCPCPSGARLGPAVQRTPTTLGCHQGCPAFLQAMGESAQ